VEEEDFGLERGDCQTVVVAGIIRRVDKTLYGGTCMGDVTEVVDVEKEDDEGHDVRVREGQVRVITLDGVNQVGNVESPKERRKTTTFRQTFEDLDVGGVVGEPVEDTVYVGVMECVDALPEVKWDVIVV
jgi:hypothetical protein